MSNMLLFALGAIIILALLWWLFLRWQNKDVGNRSPKSVLNEVEVLMEYGLKKDAIVLLKSATQKHPNSEEIRQKLVELE